MNKLRIFSKWYKRSSVRSAPRRLIEARPQYKFFSARLAPFLNHPQLQALPSDQLRNIEIQLLYQYLQFTEYLETAWVNKVMEQIMNKKLPLQIPAPLHQEAYKIYCDEAYHALQAHDTMIQLEKISQKKPLVLAIPLKKRLQQLRKACPEHLQDLFELFFVCVSETLVSQELSEYDNDPTIHPDIQSIMHDHALDEATHALFFKEVIQLLKKQLPLEDFNWFAKHISIFAGSYLYPCEKNLQKIFQQDNKDIALEELMAFIFDEQNLTNKSRKASVQLQLILKNI